MAAAVLTRAEGLVVQESIPMEALPASIQEKSEKQDKKSTPVDDLGRHQHSEALAAHTEGLAPPKKKLWQF